MQKGFSLIEILMSLLLLSFILLGFDAMEINALQKNQNAYYFSVAENQLYSLCEHLRVAKESLNVPMLVNAWNQQNIKVLLHGKGYVHGVYPSFKVTIFWGEKTDEKECKGIQLAKSNCLTQQVYL